MENAHGSPEALHIAAEEVAVSSEEGKDYTAENSAALNGFLESHRQELLDRLERYLGSFKKLEFAPKWAADDVAQEASERMVKHLQAYPDQRIVDMASYFWTTAFAAATDWIREKRSQKTEPAGKVDVDENTQDAPWHGSRKPSLEDQVDAKVLYESLVYGYPLPGNRNIPTGGVDVATQDRNLEIVKLKLDETSSTEIAQKLAEMGLLGKYDLSSASDRKRAVDNIDKIWDRFLDGLDREFADERSA